jgi:hypothetical protein
MKNDANKTDANIKEANRVRSDVVDSQDMTDKAKQNWITRIDALGMTNENKAS